MRRAALASVVPVLFLVGCTPTTSTSTGDFKGAERDVAQRVADLADAGTKREPADICGGVVSEKLREEIAAGDSTCNDEMQKAIEDVDDFELDVEDVAITGETATARVTSTDRDRKVTRTFEFVREGGDWRIDSFG